MVLIYSNSHFRDPFFLQLHIVSIRVFIMLALICDGCFIDVGCLINVGLIIIYYFILRVYFTIYLDCLSYFIHHVPLTIIHNFFLNNHGVNL